MKDLGPSVIELQSRRVLIGHVREVAVGRRLFLRVDLAPPEVEPAGVHIACGDRSIVVDVIDAPFAWAHHWTINAGGYAYRRDASGAMSYLHRDLLQAPAGRLVDHRNGDTLDNRRSNLRLCTHAQNIRNQRHRTDGVSRYRGVLKSRGRWVARIKVDYRQIHLGTYEHEHDAALVYDVAARKHFGDFARPNFPDVELLDVADIHCITLTTEAA